MNTNNMKTFYETYKVLLLELSFDEVTKLMDSEKFKGIFTDIEYLAVKNIIMSIIPNDIREKDKANALNWLISSIKNEKQNKQYIIRAGGATLLSNYHMELRKYLELFYQIKQQNLADKFLKYSAIERYKTFEEFVVDLIEAEGPYQQYNSQKIERSTKGEGQLLVYENDIWQVYFPQTKGAACSLGKDTDWCTAAPGLNYYEHYSKSGQLIIFISKKDPSIKYQLHYAGEQYMDEEDVSIGCRVAVLNKIIVDHIMGSEFEKYLSEKDREKISDLKATPPRNINDNYSLVEGEVEDDEEGVFRSKEIVNNFTLKSENPYSPTYCILKTFHDNGISGTYYYKVDRDHPDNPDRIWQINVDFDFDEGKETIEKCMVLRSDGLGNKSYPVGKMSALSRFMTLGVK